MNNQKKFPTWSRKLNVYSKFANGIIIPLDFPQELFTTTTFSFYFSSLVSYVLIFSSLTSSTFCVCMCVCFLNNYIFWYTFDYAGDYVITIVSRCWYLGTRFFLALSTSNLFCCPYSGIFIPFLFIFALAFVSHKTVLLYIWCTSHIFWEVHFDKTHSAPQ